MKYIKKDDLVKVLEGLVKSREGKNCSRQVIIEYQIYKDCTSNNSTPRSSANSSGSSFWIVFIIACIVDAFCGGLGVLIMLGYGFLKLLGM